MFLLNNYNDNYDGENTNSIWMDSKCCYCMNCDQQLYCSYPLNNILLLLKSFLILNCQVSNLQLLRSDYELVNGKTLYFPF